MITYLEKYNQLPAEVKAGVSTPEVIGAIEALEKEYDITLASVVMRVLVRDISLVDLPQFFAFEYNMAPRLAEKLVDEIKDKVFKGVGAYLGLSIDPVMDADVAEKPAEPEPTAWGPPVRSSNFFFSSEDEEEVKTLAKKLKIEEAESQALKRESDEQLNLKVDSIIDKVSLNFSSEELHQRFRKIIFTYAKGIRNRIDTRQAMLKDVKDGGLGLNDALLNRILKIADEVKDGGDLKAPKTAAPEIRKESDKKNEFSPDQAKPIFEFNTKPEASVEAPKPFIAADRDAPYDFRSLSDAGRQQAEKKEENREKVRPFSFQEVNKLVADSDNRETARPEVAGALTPEPDKKIDLQPAVKNEKDEKESMRIDLSVKKAKPENEPANTPLIVNRRPVAGRVRLEDVKKMPKLSGPVDELKDLDMLNFRRLSGDPAKAAAKINEKLRFLEEDSYEKRLQGIKAWRQSAVNKEYLAIGQESIAKNKGVEDIINERRQNSQDTLSYGEFLAIMDLNKSIRF